WGIGGGGSCRRTAPGRGRPREWRSDGADGCHWGSCRSRGFRGAARRSSSPKAPPSVSAESLHAPHRRGIQAAGRSRAWSCAVLRVPLVENEPVAAVIVGVRVDVTGRAIDPVELAEQNGCGVRRVREASSGRDSSFWATARTMYGVTITISSVWLLM